MMITLRVAAAVGMRPKVPVVLHQDHGNSPQTCYSAIQNGFTSVMMDGSLEADCKTPASYEYNVDITKKVVETAHAIGVSVEGFRKINIDTDCRLAMAAELRRVATTDKGQFDPRKFLDPALGAMQKLCEQRYEDFGTAGQASRLRGIDLPSMAARYGQGELDPKIAA